MSKPLKMYICVKQELPSHKCVAVAHGVLMCHLKFQHLPYYKEWLEKSFRKVVCEVTNEQFEILKQTDCHVTVTESGLGGMEVALVFSPRENWPELFRELKMVEF